jgi:hypothetical protein
VSGINLPKIPKQPSTIAADHEQADAEWEVLVEGLPAQIQNGG